MKIGVISDTHSHEIPEQVISEFKDVDLIIHAGDFCTLEDLAIIEKIAPVQGVFGNMDCPDICKKFPESQIVDADGCRIGITHGKGSPEEVLSFVQAQFLKENINIAIFGHSHQPLKEKINNVLYFNPGSPNDKIFAPYCSFGLIEVNDGKFNAEIIKVKD